jgi:D-cysteine desulfhydrase
VTEPALLRDKIRGALAPCRLGEWPTPLEPAPGLARALGLAELCVKREDRSSVRAGGNKVRGLEFLFAGVASGTVFVTVGAAGSTHCLATAVHAARVACRAVLVQFPQPETRESRAVAAACAAHAALVVRARARMTLPAALWAAWRAAGALGGRRRWIPGGGAAPAAVVGQFLAGLELASQVARPPDAIVLPLGTGGTAAGLVLAVTELGWPTKIIAVRVAPALVANRWRVHSLARAAARLLARHGVVLGPAARPVPLAVVDGVGKGYGHPTPEGERARALAATHGLTLDPTYGAKALALLLRGLPGGVQHAVFWHTFALPRVDVESGA